MSTNITLQDAQAKLIEIIHQLAPGEEIIITENQQPVAKLVSQKPSPHPQRSFGLGKGMITIVSDDDDHLKDFEEYMQ